MPMVIAEPEAWQELHSPTEEVLVRIDATRTTALGRRRKADARLFDAMDPDQLRAAQTILAGFTAITGPVAVKVQNLHRVDGGQGSTQEFLVYAQHAYVTWGQECFKAGVSHSAVMDVLAYGLGVREVDRNRRKRNGWALENLQNGLTLFCNLQQRK